MHELSQRFFFDAAHTLRREIEVEGSRRIHGHTYHAEVFVRGEPASGTGMVVDLGHIRREVNALREDLDHHFLDEVAGLGPATLENLCTFIWKRLQPRIPGLSAVSVGREALGDKCVYRPTAAELGSMKILPAQSGLTSDLSISLLYTTARPHLIEHVINRWLPGWNGAVEMIVVTDNALQDPPLHSNIRFLVNQGRRDCVTGWNLAAQNSSGQILVQVSDDLFPPAGWANTIRKLFTDLGATRKDVVLNLLDERKQTDAVFHPILSRTAYEKLNYLYPPDFESMFCDNWFCAYHKKHSYYFVSDKVFWHHEHRTTHDVKVDAVMQVHESPERYTRGRETFLKYVREQGL